MGICSADSVINLALCCLGYIPGLLHAWYIILKYPEPDYDNANYEPIPADAQAHGRRGDAESGRQATYYFVARQSQAPPQPAQQRDYGTVESLPPQAPAHSKPAYRPEASQEQAGSSSRSSSSHAAQGSSGSRPPPTYAEAIQGDHKIQTPD